MCFSFCDKLLYFLLIQILFTELYDQLHMKHCVHTLDFIKSLCNKREDLFIFHLLPSFLLY